MKFKIAVFPGDGTGPELINEGIKVIEKAAELDKFELEFVKYPHGAEHYAEIKEELTEKALRQIKNSCSAIYCGTFDAANGQQKSADLIIKAIESVLRENRTRTHDLNGNNSTSEMGDAIADKFIEIHD